MVPTAVRWAPFAVIVAACGESGFHTAAHKPLPQVVDRGGPKLASVDLVTVTFAGFPYRDEVESLGDWMVTSDWYLQIGREYTVGTGTQSAKVRLPDEAPLVLSLDVPPKIGDVGNWLETAILRGRLPHPRADKSTLYMLYFLSPDPCETTPFPPGFHDSTSSTAGVPFGAVIPCKLASGRVSSLESVEVAATHELAEAATDPFPETAPGFLLPDDQPWGFAFGPEVGDLCETSTMRIDGHRVQRIWSNTHAVLGEDPCSPADDSSPYFNIAGDLDTVSVEAGDFVRISLTGWSTVPVHNWSTAVAARVLRGVSGNPFVPLIRDPLTGHDVPLLTEAPTPIPGAPLLNNGQEASMLISVPLGTPGGNRVILDLLSIGASTRFSAMMIQVR
jgi:hypothetical protein